MSMKCIGFMMMVGSEQMRVIVKSTFADAVAMSGVTREYMSETGNDKETAWLGALPENIMYVVPKMRDGSQSPSPVPENYVRYASAKDKKRALDDKREKKALRIEEGKLAAEERASEMQAARRERIAQTLYGFDVRNEPWEEVSPETKKAYHAKAEIIIEAGWGK